ncbi:MAG: CopG family transcriptional regulator [Vicinamibacterales bacterium]
MRRTISLPPAIAARLDEEAKRRGSSVSAVVAELVQRQPSPLPYAGIIDDDPELSMKVEEVLARLGR